MGMEGGAPAGPAIDSSFQYRQSMNSSGKPAYILGLFPADTSVGGQFSLQGWGAGNIPSLLQAFGKRNHVLNGLHGVMASMADAYANSRPTMSVQAPSFGGEDFIGHGVGGGARIQSSDIDTHGLA